jgi:hypothetical protein
MNIKHVALVITSIAMALSLVSCSFFGPSDEEIVEALNGAFAGFHSVPIMEDHVALKFRHQDTVEVSYENDAKTITQSATLVLDRAKSYLSCKGECTFNNYSDEKSRFLMTGTISYDFGGYVDRPANLKDCELVFHMKYKGGGRKVESIEFKLNEAIYASGRFPRFLVNGKNRQVEEQLKRDIMNFLKEFKM